MSFVSPSWLSGYVLDFELINNVIKLVDDQLTVVAAHYNQSLLQRAYEELPAVINQTIVMIISVYNLLQSIKYHLKDLGDEQR